MQTGSVGTVQCTVQTLFLIWGFGYGKSTEETGLIAAVKIGEWNTHGYPPALVHNPWPSMLKTLVYIPPPPQPKITYKIPRFVPELHSDLHSVIYTFFLPVIMS